MGNALSFFNLDVTEKIVGGTFNSINNWINGRNTLNIEREKTKQCAIMVGGVLVGAALAMSIFDEIDINVGDNHFRAAKH